jgi:hypothetical protein
MDNNFKKKNKFIENLEIKINKQPYYDIDNMTTDINDILKETYNSKNKSRLELKDNLDPYNYEIGYFNRIKKDTKGQEFIYYSPYDQGPGRGFGNLNVNNNIRKSESSRNTTEDFRLFRESEIIDRFDYIDNRFMKSKNLVFPYPRSGDTTRKAPTAPRSQNLSNGINNYNFNPPINLLQSNLVEPNLVEPNKLPNADLINKIKAENNKIIDFSEYPDSINYELNNATNTSDNNLYKADNFYKADNLANKNSLNSKQYSLNPNQYSLNPNQYSLNPNQYSLNPNQ